MNKRSIPAAAFGGSAFLDLLPSAAVSRQDAGALGRTILRLADLAAVAHRFEQAQQAAEGRLAAGREETGR